MEFKDYYHCELFFSLALFTQHFHILTPYICWYCTKCHHNAVKNSWPCFGACPTKNFALKRAVKLTIAIRIIAERQDTAGVSGRCRFCLAAQGQVKIERLCVGLNDAPLNRSPPQSVADEAVHGSNLISCRTPLLYIGGSLIAPTSAWYFVGFTSAATFKFAVRRAFLPLC